MLSLGDSLTAQVGSVNGAKLFSIKRIIFALFILLITLNLSGLWPFVFSSTRHLWFSISLGVTVWLALLISGWAKDFKRSAAHLNPSGSPLGLRPLLVLIETVSLLIRPLSLSVRLVANIRTGHIVIALIGCFLSSLTSVTRVSLVFIINAFYFIFEVGVRAIQAYIFFLLLSLYSDDH